LNLKELTTNKKEKKAMVRKRNMASLAEEISGRTRKEDLRIGEERNRKFEEELKSKVAGNSGKEVLANQGRATVGVSVFLDARTEALRFIKGDADTEEKKKFVIYLCVSALGKRVSVSFEKALGEKTSRLDFLKSVDTAHIVAGAIGAAILSQDMLSLPVELQRVKETWMASNGKYPSVFASNRIKREDQSIDIMAAMIDAASHFDSGMTSELTNAISQQVPSLTFKNRSWLHERVFLPVRKTSFLVLSFLPRSPFQIKAYTRTVVKSYIAASVRYSLLALLVYSLYCRAMGRGMVRSMFLIMKAVIFELYLFAFGSGAEGVINFIVTLIVLVLVGMCFPEIYDDRKGQARENAKRIIEKIEVANRNEEGPAVPRSITVGKGISGASVYEDARSFGSHSARSMKENRPLPRNKRWGSETSVASSRRSGSVQYRWGRMEHGSARDEFAGSVNEEL
jgi:hypothetical protein